MELNSQTDRADVIQWINSQDWYQRIQLPGGLETPGKIDSKQRLQFLDDAIFEGQSVLDVGCNSGFYSFWAKEKGADRVVGIDLDEQRLYQARALSAIQAYDIEFYNQKLDGARELGQFDIVLCFAVLTEIPDLLGSLNEIAQLTRKRAYVELELARPLLYASRSRYWVKSLFMSKYPSSTLELKPSKAGWTLSPSLSAIRKVLGNDFTVHNIGKGLRYDMLCIERK